MSEATSRPRLRAAVIGAGYVAAHHLAALRRLDFVEVVAVCDADPEAAERTAARFGIDTAVSRVEDLWPLRLDLVHVLTPPASHAALAIEAMRNGCHVLVEKPMADTAGDCEAMLEVARQTGRTLGVNHSDLFDPVVRQALDAARAGRIGELRSVDVIRNSDYPAYGGGPLPSLVTQGSYPLRDLGVHALYTIEAFLGGVRTLDVRFQSCAPSPNLGFSEWQGQAQAAQGIGRMLLSWTARPMENRLVVRGTAGIIEVDRFLQTCSIKPVLPGPKFVGIVLGGWWQALRDTVRIPWNLLRFATGRLQPSPGIRDAAAAFAHAVRDGRPAPFPGEDGLRIASLLDGACVEPDRVRAEELQQRMTPVPPADVLVTGAGGFLGRALVARLRGEGRRVRVLLRNRREDYDADAGIQTVIGDLGDPAIVAHAVAGVEVVHHVGAAMRGGPREFQAGTVWGTRNVVEACIAHGVRRLVHVSSMSVFDHAGRDPQQAMTEASPLEPHPDRRGAYTGTKMNAERIVLDAVAQRGLSAVVLRPGQIFGRGAERVTPNGVLGLAGRWVLVGDGSQSLPLVYVDDVVDALLCAERAQLSGAPVFNIVDTAAVTQRDYLARVRSRLGDELKLVRVPRWLFMGLAWAVERLGRLLGREVPLTRYRVRSLRPLAGFDTTAARERLQWTPRVGVAQGLDATFG